MLRLRPRARAMLLDADRVESGDADSATVARLLLDRGLADPVFDAVPADDAVDDVTVVVPVRDRPRQLARLLAALPARRCRSWWSTTAPEDPRNARAGGRQSRRRAGLRHPVSRGPAAARNTGLGRVRTPYVAFLDSDVVPEPGLARGGCAGTSTTRRRDASGPASLGASRATDDALAVPLRGGPVLARPRTPAAAGPAARPGRLPAERRPAGPPRRPSSAGLRRADAGGRGRRPGLAAARRRLAGALRARGRRTPRPPDRRSRPWLRRKAFYGTGAALLADAARLRRGAAGADARGRPRSPWPCWPSDAGRCPPPPWSARRSTVRRSPRGCARPTDPVRTAALADRDRGRRPRCQQTGSALTRHYWPLALCAAALAPAGPAAHCWSRPSPTRSSTTGASGRTSTRSASSSPAGSTTWPTAPVSVGRRRSAGAAAAAAGPLVRRVPTSRDHPPSERGHRHEQEHLVRDRRRGAAAGQEAAAARRSTARCSPAPSAARRTPTTPRRSPSSASRRTSPGLPPSATWPPR